MGHPEINNKSPFEFAPLCLVGESGRPLLVGIVKATFAICKSGLLLAEQQLPVNFTGECRGDPATNSYKYEPETAWAKPHTDVVLIAHAWAPRANTRTVDVGFRVGPVQQVARVFGDRVWYAGSSITEPRPFERVPLIYERAFGGVDPVTQETDQPISEPQNPLGKGFYHKGRPEDGAPVANIEAPNQLIESPRDRPKPVGFGFTCPNFHPRVQFGGTYDQKWAETRKPFLPTDFNRRFFNAAPPSLILPGRLKGMEAVVVRNASSRQDLTFTLPPLLQPILTVSRRHGFDVVLRPELDTVIVNTDDAVVVLLWRALLEVATGLQDVRSIEIAVEGSNELKTEAPQARIAGVPQ